MTDRTNSHVAHDHDAGRPRVSVLVPTFNVEPYLEAALDSLINQTMEDLEIVCVDDGSTDSSPEILARYAEAHSDRLKVVTQSNAGYGVAMNVALRHATGEYIGILEPDDVVRPGMFETLWQAGHDHDLDIVKADYLRFRGRGESRTEVIVPCANNSSAYGEVIDPSERLAIFRYPMNTWCGVYRRQFLIDNDIWHHETPGASYQDNGFFFQTMCQARRVMYINEVFYENRRDNPNSSVKSTGKADVALQEYDWIREWLLEHPSLAEKFTGVYGLKRWHNIDFTMKRLAPGIRREFCRMVSDVLKKDAERGVLVQSAFGVGEWNRVQWIMRDPDEYYYQHEAARVKVSVVMPVYNGMPHLEECLASLRDQSLRDFEVILVDDGSTDGSYEVLRDFAESDAYDRVILLSQEHQGAGAARNLGLEQAQGEYVAFLDADDVFDKGMLGRAYGKAKADRANICVFRSRNLDSMTGKTSPIKHAVKIDKLPKARPFAGMHINDNPFFNFVGWPWDKLFLRTYLLNTGLRFQPLTSTNDAYFVYSALLLCDRITILDEELISHRRNVATSISNSTSKSPDNAYRALLAIRDQLELSGIYPQLQRKFVNYALHLLLWHLNNLPEEAREDFYSTLQSEWFPELGVSDKPLDFFTQPKERATLGMMRYSQEHGSGSYWDIAFLQTGPGRAAQAERDRSAWDDANTESEAAETIRRLERVVAQRDAKIEQIRNSESWRVGHAIVAAPRSILNIFGRQGGQSNGR
ncbi:glycosyltransferase [Isoptericola sp. b408]|uniref:glycosyltransferase n=1 Tax=Isoptericola sp. b408 TaxID=3064653 RepID=UPI002712C0C4|nr:glycosyltransferase [Isoptericola sp. b408]MDO8152295.1 glycosyltransferase [Isoptericola sp. b408]